MSRWFFLYYPHSVPKAGAESGLEHGFRNSLTRDDFIKKFGEERFLKISEADPNWRRYREPEVPKGCSWLFGQFLYIYFNAEREPLGGQAVMTFRTLNDYVECMKVPLTVGEKRLLLKMRDWANAEVAGLTSRSARADGNRKRRKPPAGRARR